MSVDALADETAEGLADRLGLCLRAGTVLDLQGAAIPAEVLRSALLGKPPTGQIEPVVPLADVDPRGLLITNAAIQGHLDLRNATISSAVTITSSTISAGINLRGARLSHGLDLTGSTVSTLNLRNAAINGSLRLSAAQLTGTDQDGISLVADGLQVDSSTFLDEGFTAAVVHLPGARISGQLSMRGAQLTGTNQDGTSLAADGLQVDSNTLLDQGFTAAGAVRLPGAQISGQLNIEVKGIQPATVDSPGLNLTGAVVDDLRLNLRDVTWVDRAKVRPDPPSLPTQRVVLSLENCAYKHRPTGSLETWLRVLRFHTPGYEPRSYQNLAGTHRATGHDRDAARILMAQQDHRRATVLRPRSGTRFRHRVALRVSRAGLAFWKATLGYGYRPRRALAWLLVLLSTAGLLVAVAAHWQADPNTPDVPVAYRPGNPVAGTPPEYCSAGEAAGLAVRIAIPLVTNLGQGACVINTATTPGSVIVGVSIALQTFAWILGGLTIAAAATAIKRSP